MYKSTNFSSYVERANVIEADYDSINDKILEVIEYYTQKYVNYMGYNLEHIVDYCKVFSNKYIECRLASSNRYVILRCELVWDYGEFNLKITSQDTNDEHFKVYCTNSEELYDYIEGCFEYMTDEEENEDFEGSLSDYV